MTNHIFIFSSIYPHLSLFDDKLLLDVLGLDAEGNFQRARFVLQAVLCGEGDEVVLSIAAELQVFGTVRFKSQRARRSDFATIILQPHAVSPFVRLLAVERDLRGRLPIECGNPLCPRLAALVEEITHTLLDLHATPVYVLDRGDRREARIERLRLFYHLAVYFQELIQVLIAHALGKG